MKNVIRNFMDLWNKEHLLVKKKIQSQVILEAKYWHKILTAPKYVIFYNDLSSD